MIVSFLPIKDAAKIQFSFHWYEMASQVNSAGLFRDLFFLMIVFTVTSFSNVLYNFVREGLATLPTWVKSVEVVICLYYILVLVQGSKTYVQIAQEQGPVPTSDFLYDFIFLTVALTMTFVAEIGLSLTDEVRKSRVIAGAAELAGAT
jgi:hypothetical protein